jgi:cell fate regulator YaaT (PSP1 superfamily)
MNRIAQVIVGEGPGMECFVSADAPLHESDQCVVDAHGVLEFGRVARLENAAGDVGRESRMPRVVRQATLQDQAKADENAVREKIAKQTCVEKTKKFNLAMRLVRVHYSFDRSVLTVLFASEERLDFRDMVRELSEELRARIEMHQIGVRDEAGIIGGLGPCGRVLCCCKWLRHFESINVKMAKIQRLSLNPGAISGMCGRLKCCLRYECDQYRDLGRTLPRHGCRVDCPSGRGTVIDSDVLRQRVRLRLDGSNRAVECPVDDVRRCSPGPDIHEEDAE